MQGPYAEYILDAADVCRNCLRKNRVERVDPVFAPGFGKQLDTHYSRDRRETVVDYHDTGDEPPKAKGVWCDCGVEGSHDRIWDDDDDRCFRMRQVKDLIKNAVNTLEAKGVDFHRRRFVELSLQYYRDDHDLDDALSQALETAIRIQAAKPNRAKAD